MPRRSSRKRTESWTQSRVDNPDPISSETSLDLKLSWRPSWSVLTDLTELQTSSRPSTDAARQTHRRIYDLKFGKRMPVCEVPEYN